MNTSIKTMRPILYTFRRCPYAMRARLAIKYSGIEVELREVDLNNIPAALAEVSADDTVPLLVLPDGKVIDESWDIVKWAVHTNDPNNWLGTNDSFELDAEMLIETNDYSFKQDLDHYKYVDRYPEYPMEHYRSLGEEFIEELEEKLAKTRYLDADTLSICDIAVFPFIRQFVAVDQEWFDTAPYPNVRNWLNSLIESDLFLSVMDKYPLWQEGDEPIIF